MESEGQSDRNEPALAHGEGRRGWRARLKALGFRLAALATALLVCVVVLEGYLRASGWRLQSQHPIGSLYRHHAVMGREHIPSREVELHGLAFRINAAGFRDPDPTALERAPGSTRIALLGDSFVWGWRVREEAMVSERLQALAGGEVINMGAVAFGTGEEWLLYRERGAAYRPDVVVLGFYVENDFADNLSKRWKSPHFDVGDDGSVVVGNLPVPYPASERLSAFLKEHLLAYHFVGHHTRRARTALRSGQGLASRAYNWVGSFRRERKARESADLGHVDLYRRDPGEVLREGERLAAAILRELERAVSAHGGRLLVAVIPAREQVDPEDWQARLSAWTAAGASAADLDRARPTAAVVGICERLGIAALDLTPALAAAHAAGPRPYFADPGETHWDERGHEVAARAIHAELERLGWLRWARERTVAGADAAGAARPEPVAPREAAPPGATRPGPVAPR